MMTLERYNPPKLVSMIIWIHLVKQSSDTISSALQSESKHQYPDSIDWAFSAATPPQKKNPRHSKWHWQEIIRYIKSLSLIKNYDTIVGHHLATYMLQIKLPWGPVSLINLSPGMGYFIVHLHLGSQGFFTLSHGGTPVQSSHNLWLWVVTPDRCAGYPYLFAIDAVAPRMKLSNVVVLQVLL